MLLVRPRSSLFCVHILNFRSQNAIPFTMTTSGGHFTRSKAVKANLSNTNQSGTRYEHFLVVVWPPQCVFCIFYGPERPSTTDFDASTMMHLSEDAAASQHLPRLGHSSCYLFYTCGRGLSTLFGHWTSPSTTFWGASISHSRVHSGNDAFSTPSSFFSDRTTIL